MRIAHIADSHFDEKRRLDDNVAVHQAFVEQIRDADVDLVIHAGDFFERRSTPVERNALAEFLLACAETAPVFGVKGNHDVDGDLDVFSRLRCKHPIRILDRPTTVPGSSVEMLPGIACLALPWFSKAHLCANLSPDLRAQETTELAITAARGLLDLLRAEAQRARAERLIPILAAHVLAAGSEVSTGQTLIGQTVELSPGDLLAVGCDYVALGHIHKQQWWHDGMVTYAGSPQRHNFGEVEPKGWMLVEPQKQVEFRELPARPIVLVELEYDAAGKLVGPYLEQPEPGALVRVRYRVPPQALHYVDEATIRQDLDAHDVVFEPILVHEHHARAPEIVDAVDLWEKVRAYWTANRIEVSDEQAARVERKLREIEAERVAEPAGEAA